MINKKLRIVKTSIIPALLLSLALSGCGISSASNFSADYDDYTDYDSDSNYKNSALMEEDLAMEYSSEESAAYDTSAMPESPAEEIDSSALTDRKLIKNVYMSVETMDINPLISSIESRVSDLGGYISQSDISKGRSGLKQCSMTIRIPAEKIDGFIDQVAEDSNVVSESESIEDVTMHYTDLEAHKKALQSEYDSLLMLMGRAESMEDIITIQSRLSDVRYQMESMESSLRVLQNQVAYSTINLDINEVSQPTPKKEETTKEMIERRFFSNLDQAYDTVMDFAIDVFVNIPNIVVAIVFILLVVIILKIIVKLIRFIFGKKSSAKKGKNKGRYAQPEMTYATQNTAANTTSSGTASAVGNNSAASVTETNAAANSTNNN